MSLSNFVFCFLFLILFSCEQKSRLNYSQEKLVDVTKDLYIAAESIRSLDETRADSLRELYNDQIEAIHNVEIRLYEEDIKVLKKDHKNYLQFHKVVRDTILAINDSIKVVRPYKNEKKK